MPFEKMTDQIEKIKKDREQFQLATLDVFSRYEQDSRRLYIITFLITAFFAAISITQIDQIHNIQLYKISVTILVVTSIISLARFISLLEFHSRKFYTSYHNILDKQNREIYVLEKFKYGHIDTNEIREYYADQAKELQKFERPKHFSITLAWIIFILFAISLILFVLSL